VSSVGLGSVLCLAAVALVGVAAFYRLDAARSVLGSAFVGAVAVYVIGAAMPYLTHNPQILELHLLRSGGTIHLLAGTAVATLATKWMCSVDDRRLFFWGCLIALLLCATQLSFVFCIPMILGTYFLRTGDQSPLVHASGYVVLAVLVGILCPYKVWQSIDTYRQYARGTAEWTAVGDWARHATPPDSIFMIPTDATTEPAKPGARTPMFEFVSHRRVWVDLRRGAAVLWTPSYYQTWRSRMNDAAHLGSLADRIDYARAKGIGYVIEGCAAAAAQQEIVFRSDRLCVFSGKAAS